MRLRDVPGFVPSQMRLVEQNAHQFRHRHRRMRVVQLNGGLLRRKSLQSVLPRRKRRTASASEQATRKYSCTKRRPCPMLVESSG